MRSLDVYFSRTEMEAFKAQLPALRAQLGVKPFAEHDAHFGVGGETFRAYRRWTRAPSQLYREWADHVCRQVTAGDLIEHMSTQRSFDRWHGRLTDSLQRLWRSKEEGGLSVAHRYKLIDLFVKWLSGHDCGDARVTRGLEQYAHCALDRQTLGKLNACVSFALPMPHPSMGDVLNENTYAFCQTLIGRFASRCGGTPLLFDYFAWKRGG